MMNNRQIQQRRPHGWRERWMHRFGMDVVAAPLHRGELTVPNWMTGKTLVIFFVAAIMCWGAFGYVPEFDLVLTACLSAVLFLYGGMSMSKSWSGVKEKAFVKNVFVAGFVIRFLWILYLYFFFNPEHYGNTFGDRADVEWYMPFGQAIAECIGNGFDRPLAAVIKEWGAAIDDTAYPMWLGIVYLLTGNMSDVFIPFLVKCVIGGYSAVLIYRVAKRHFGEGTARMAAIFVCVNPNLIYWCGSMMKEAEMVFLCCLSVEQLDAALSTGKMRFKTLWPGMLAAIALFFFRSALGLVVFLAVFAHIVMASQRVMSTGKKVIAGVLVFALLVVSIGDRVMQQSRSMLNNVEKGGQQENMEWRSNREGGNSLARYAGAAVFAPLIFTLPFPTFNQANTDQIVQVQLAGGSYVKNILSFFIIIVMLMMLISGEWRQHVFILAFTVGYLAVLVFSGHAQSGRFHMPVFPMLMLFAAYGVQIAKSNGRMKRWFNMALLIEVVACLAWNWFKLKGRGMI